MLCEREPHADLRTPQEKRLSHAHCPGIVVGMDTQHDFSAAEAHFDAMKNFLHHPEAHQLDLSGLEQRLSTDGRELLRQLLCAHITARGGGDIGAGVVGMDGVKRTHKRLRPRTIITLFARSQSSGWPTACPMSPACFPWTRC